MDVSFDVYESSREIEEERIAICQWLTELDPSSKGEYLEEIVGLTKLINIQDGIRDVDSSRVYVDVEAIARWARREIQENYTRYKSLVRAGVGFGSPQNLETALKQFASGDDHAVDDYLTYPVHEGDSLLLDMLASLTNEYLTNSDYGLDAYLSMRIRHGSLSGHLRGPLEERALVVAKDGKSDRYGQNDVWLSRLSLQSDSARSSLVSAFQRFSGKYDDIINDLIQKKLQIYDTKQPEGMFRLNLTENPLLLHVIRSRIQHDTEFDDFLRLVFLCIREALQNALREVQKFISVSVKQRVDGAFEGLRSQLDDGMDRQSYVVLNSTIADVVPEVQAAIDRVAAWFSSGESEQESVVRTLDQIVDIGIEATKRARQGFSPLIDKHVSDVDVSGTSVLSEFTDILFTILDNVYVHSGNPISPNVRIIVDCYPDRNSSTERLVIRVENQIAAESHNSENVNKLKRIRDQMDSGAYRKRVNLEGGTGLLKLKRLVSLDRNQTFEFGYLGEDEFFVELGLVFVRM